MAQAAQPILQGPPAQPAAGSGKLKLLIVPLVVLVLLAIPAGAYAYANNELNQGQSLEQQQQYAQAISAYQTAFNVAGNPAAKIILGDQADKATVALARTHYEWGKQDQAQSKFSDAQDQFTATISSGLADWTTQGNAALAQLLLAWGDSLLQNKQFLDAITKYKQVSDYDTPGTMRAQTTESLAKAYFAYAGNYAANKDYANALSWYQDLVKSYPDSPEAKQALATQIPQTLYNGALADVAQQRYQQARDEMNQVITQYPRSSWAGLARAAMSASQPLTGKLMTSAGQAVPFRLLRISTKWVIVAPHTYDDYGGKIFSTTTDANGNFSLMVPPGSNYLVTWWDPSRGTFVTTFVSDTVPVNQVTINPLEPEHANVEVD